MGKNEFVDASFRLLVNNMFPEFLEAENVHPTSFQVFFLLYLPKRMHIFHVSILPLAFYRSNISFL